MCIRDRCKGSRNLKDLVHPKHAIYLLGAEDQGIPEELMKGHQKVHIDTPHSLNVAVAGSIIMYDRSIKLKQ